MSISTLRPVPSAPAPKSIADQIRQLQAEARALAAESVALAIYDAKALAARFTAMADCTVYGPGVREEARRAAEDLKARADGLTAIQQRQP